EADALAADGVPRRQQFCGGRVVHDLTDLAANELGRVEVRLRVGRGVLERAHEGEAADRPALLELGLALLVRHLERGLVVERPPRAERSRHGPVARPQALVVGLDLGHFLRCERPVPGRHGVAGRALEHREVGGHLGDDGDGLDRRRAGADDAHPRGGQVDLLAWPPARVQHQPAEVADAVDVGKVGRRQAPGRHDQELGGDVVTTIGPHPPPGAGLVEHRLGHPRLEPDVAVEVEPRRDVLEVAQDLRLPGVPLRPLPLLLELLGEPVGVLHALDVAPRPGVAVPVPRAAHVVAGLEHDDAQAVAAEAVQGVHPAEPGAHDHDVQLLDHGHQSARYRVRVIDAVIDDLRVRLGDRLSTAAAVLDEHGRDEGWHPAATPDAVVFPDSTAEVVEVVRACAARGVPVVPFGAGTSLEGNVTPLRGGVTIDLTRMGRILEVNVDDLDCRVEAGVTRNTLNRALAREGLFFPIDPGADATLGGMAATRASGTNAVRYGTMKDNVLGLTAVLADGSVVHTGTRARKSSAGYDLTRLLVGSEGTLGVITEVTVRLYPVQEAMGGAVCSFASLAGAVRTVIEAIQLGVPVARLELLDDVQVEACN